MNILKKENIKYYQIDDAKNKELEHIFNKINLKIIFPSKARILRDGKFYTISKGCFTIYKEKFYNKLFEIKIRGSDKITSVIELDNKDIIFFKNEQLIIYRLKDGKYSLLQKIKESRVGYEIQFSSSGYSEYLKTYRALYIKEISGNRFISVSNYGFKIYALNDKNEYSIVLLENYHECIQKIYELDKDNFILCSLIDWGDSLLRRGYNILILDKIQLKEISKKEKDAKLREIEYSENHIDLMPETHKLQKNMNTENEAKIVIESLKYNCKYNEFFELSNRGEYHYFRGEIIIKNKYLLVGIDNSILLSYLKIIMKVFKKYMN